MMRMGVTKTKRMKLTWHMILNVLIPREAFCWCTSHACHESHAKLGGGGGGGGNDSMFPACNFLHVLMLTGQYLVIPYSVRR